MDIEIMALRNKKVWITVYLGSRNDIPEKYRELVALLDASDNWRISGVGARTEGGVDYRVRYYLSSLLTQDDQMGAWYIDEVSTEQVPYSEVE